MNLSRSFTLAEMTQSQTAARRGLDNNPASPVVNEMKRLCEMILQPLRDAVGRPVIISSGYRSPAVNEAVGGAANSAHMLGRAADILVPGMSVRDVCKTIASLRLPYEQLIDEFDSWCHVAIAPFGTVSKREQLAARRAESGTLYSRVTF